MSRICSVFLLGGLAIAFSPAVANAQFGRYYGASPLYAFPNPGGGYGYGLQFNFGFHAQSIYGPVNIPFILPFTYGANYAPPMYSPGYSTGYGYLRRSACRIVTIRSRLSKISLPRNERLLKGARTRMRPRN